MQQAGNRNANGSGSTQEENARAAASPADIDFLAVAESHVRFFARVKDFILGELTESKEHSEEIGDCDLDRWLQGQGASDFGNLASFDRLREAHAEFHRLAAEVLAKVDAGSWIAAEHMRRGRLAESLRRVLMTITELNDLINRPRVGG